MVGVSFMIIVICCLGGLARTAEDFKKTCTWLHDYGDCSSKSLYTIPSDIPKWMTRLNLNNNYIRTLEGSEWRNLSQLRDLKLNKNKIQKIQKDMFENMRKLEILELNRNQLSVIEALSFQPLECVNTLKMKRNQISNLPDGSFFGLTHIKILLLDYNSVTVIKKGWLYNLGNLKTLSLSYNLIHTIENDAWEFCKKLIELDLSYNHIQAIKKDTFNDLEDLQKLILNNNNITFLEENAFSHTPKLKILNLSDNKISWTVEDANSVFRGLTNLIKFYIASNDIKSINKNAFTGLSKVSLLDLDNNNITSIQRNAFAEMPLLEDLALNTNSLLCDCNLQWFYEYLRLKKLNVTTVCAYPEWLRGYPLLKVPSNNFTCDDLPKPRLIEEPGVEIMALKGEDISLTCKAMSSSPHPMRFQWKKDNVEIRNENRTVMATTDGKNTESVSYLNITKIQHSDAGKYQCIVSNTYGTTYSQKSSISVLIYPTFNKMPSNITVQAGTTARLDCSASGEPQPEVAWQKDGGNDFPAARERRMQVMPADDVFFIINAKLTDMGVYSCTAHNAAGIIVANATLNVEEKPSFVKPMEDKEVMAGESVVIQCMASGAPKPHIQWLKDGIPISATERHFFTAEEQLMIIVDTILSDGGIYTCKLNNSLGSETGHSTLIVKPDVHLEHKVLIVNKDLQNGGGRIKPNFSMKNTPHNSNQHSTLSDSLIIISLLIKLGSIIMSHDMLGIIIIAVVSCAVLTSGVWVVIIYQTRRRMAPINAIQSQPEPIMLDFTDQIINHFSDNASEHSSCKDSGTGDSAKRSNDDLLPGDEYTLIINETNTGDKNTTMRTASLVYLPDEGNASQTPLLLSNTPSYNRSTNHDRLSDNAEVDINTIQTVAEVEKV